MTFLPTAFPNFSPAKPHDLYHRHSPATPPETMADEAPDAPMAITPVLFHTTPVPLFVDTDHPGSYYALNCVAVVLATMLLRLLVALRPALEKRFWAAPAWPSASSRGKDAGGSGSGSGAFVPLPDHDDDSRGEDAHLELEESAEWRRQRQQHHRMPDPARRQYHPRSWPAIAAQRVGRAVFEVAVVGLGYLMYVHVHDFPSPHLPDLIDDASRTPPPRPSQAKVHTNHHHRSMLAVMTMNIGYFLSVLAGVFLGTVLLGSETTSQR